MSGKVGLIAAPLVLLVVLPMALIGLTFLSVTGGAAAVLGSCAAVGGPGGPPQQIGQRHWSSAQLTNARTITTVVMRRELPQHAAVLALSTAIVESRLRNLDHGDRDSLGLFQQRPSKNWGSPEQILNPVYATNEFLDHLLALDGWYSMPPGRAQQAVQHSAYPDRYAPQEPPARALMRRFWTGPNNPPPSADEPPDTGNDTGEKHRAALGCANRGGSDLPLDPQKIPDDFTLPDDPRRRAAVKYALSKLGAPYVWGAKGPNAFDCSGLTQAAWAHAGVGISAGTTNQVHDGRAVGSIAKLAPGDLVFIPGSLGSPANPRHVGLYAGHGLIVNAYDADTGVILEKLSAWNDDIVAIRRVAEPTAPQGNRA
ncbi:Cell wall-associated hydrolase, NlpC family [Actinopolyspora xinjiangensis]|uniref:Cell wall-associated hydrolase, NlpC family n=1 Tax=Actinopolyspora xinjiangensis TaxID=405564 RepID=A0A1H0X3Y8_9ACTN|nr:NlpC/P60 family protein [Actinopolyspora xinjiangensis]SDP97186.1 Cell wall-associated hydrolase, NlpC family [Actinopolyspora xinjiangensis]